MGNRETSAQTSGGQPVKKQRGILLPVFSLPSGAGIGCFSKEADAFVDYLAAEGQDAWQILPLGPVDPWYSPYQPCSVYAGEPLYIDPEALIRDGLLTEQEVIDFREEIGAPAADDAVCYETLIPAKAKLLRAAYARVQTVSCQDEMERFTRDNSAWLDDYCLFMALRQRHGGRPWTDWEPAYAAREPEALERAREELRETMAYHAWEQFVFFRQWQALRGYAASKGIRIIGDMPYYVTLDSVECWKDPALFQLDENYRPLAISGVPGDRFNRAGQVWNSPVYDWRKQREALMSWWQARIRRGFDFYDIIRLDHVRAFTAYYAIPADRPLPKYGAWEPGPGAAVFEPFAEEISEGRLIAEDLGTITKDVREMLRGTGMPGMAVLQFAFDSGKKNPYRPENIRANTIVYTGTHDNPTTTGWYQSLRGLRKRRVDRYFRNAMSAPGGEENDPSCSGGRAAMITGQMIRAAWDSDARLAVIPLQDYLGLGDEARINTPGTTAGNWTWRIKCEDLLNNEAERDTLSPFVI